MGEKYHGYDEDDIPGDIPRISDAEVDALIDERQMREIEENECDAAAQKIIEARQRLIELGVWK